MFSCVLAYWWKHLQCFFPSDSPTKLSNYCHLDGRPIQFYILFCLGNVLILLYESLFFSLLVSFESVALCFMRMKVYLMMSHLMKISSPLSNVVYSLILHLCQRTSSYKEEKGRNNWTSNRDFGGCHHFYWHRVGWPRNYSLYPGISIPSNCNHRKCLWFGIAWFGA